MLCILVGQRESKLCRYSICFIIFMSNGKIFASTSTKFYISWGNLTDQVSWSVSKLGWGTYIWGFFKKIKDIFGHRPSTPPPVTMKVASRPGNPEV